MILSVSSGEYDAFAKSLGSLGPGVELALSTRVSVEAGC